MPGEAGLHEAAWSDAPALIDGAWGLHAEGAIEVERRRLGLAPASVAAFFLAAMASGAAAAVQQSVPLVPAAADATRQGFVRVVNYSPRAGTVSIVAIDDVGQRFGELTLDVGGFQTLHFNSEDLEQGNASKGLANGTGPGQGDWRLELSSELDIETLAYIRTSDGFLTSMHDVVPNESNAYRIAIFNPGSNVDQRSILRLTNPHDEDVQATIRGTDDRGVSPGSDVTLELGAGETRMLTAVDLESGAAAGLSGALADGSGKWRLLLDASEPISAMNLMESPGGHLTNLSSVSSSESGGAHLVPLFPAASDADGRQGFVRVINNEARSGNVDIEARDDVGQVHETLELSVPANASVHFNSDDLELGNAGKGLTGSTGPGSGDWWLRLSSDLDLEVLSYVRTRDGFLTSMYDVAPVVGDRHTIAVFNPGSNLSQVSRLRLINPGVQAANVSIVSVDDHGQSPGQTIRLRIPPRGASTLGAADMESGGTDFTGLLGDGVGKWRLEVESWAPLVAMSLLASPTGHLTNLSSVPDRRGTDSGVSVPPWDATLWIDRNVIVESDPTSLERVVNVGRGYRDMFDRRTNRWENVHAHLIRADFDDGTHTEVQVNPEFDAEEAETEAEFYAKALGQLFAGLREGVWNLWIHRGDHLFGGANQSILIHTETAQQYFDWGFLEETLIHEAGHATIDPMVGTGASFRGEDAMDQAWLDAREADGRFISTYAEDLPNHEDVAESIGAYLLLRQAPERIPVAVLQTIRRTIPHRIAYFDRMNLDFYPAVRPASGDGGSVGNGEVVIPSGKSPGPVAPLRLEFERPIPD